jgi:calmodulin
MMLAVSITPQYLARRVIATGMPAPPGVDANRARWQKGGRQATTPEERQMPLTPEEREELEESFDYNDANDDGRIEFEEFVDMLNALDAYSGPEEARVGFETIDSDRDGSIDFEEFVAWWSER